MQGRQTVTSFNGELEYRPTSALKFDLGLHGYIYNDEERWANASPSFEGNVGSPTPAARSASGWRP